MADNRTWLVALREVREATRTNSFRITLAISVVALAVIIVISNLGNDDDDPERVAYVGTDAGAAAIEDIGEAIGVDVAVTTVASDDEARAAVLDGDADVAVAADGARIFTEDELDLTSGSSRATLVSVLRAELALENGLRAAGLSPEEAAEVRSAPPPDVEALAAEPDDEVDSERVGTAMITNILLFLMLQMYGGWVLTAVTREKASRVVEVLLAVITPRQLLIGKVVGIGIVALIHAAVLIATALVATRVMGVDLSIGASPGDLAIALVWFVLGYALYCGAFAAAGSLVSRTEDAQGAAFPIMLPLLFAYIVSFSAADGANTLIWVLAFIPFTAVVAMPTLYALGEAPLWAVGVSMLLTVVAVVGVTMLAAKIYERSVLHSRKLSWRDAFRQRGEIDTVTARPAPASAHLH